MTTPTYRILRMGAIGDAVGWPIEFARGPFDAAPPARLGLGEVTDDTQMTLFAAEGLVDAVAQVAADGSDPTSLTAEAISDFRAAVVHHARLSFLEWYATQRPSLHRRPTFAIPPTRLTHRPALHKSRAPGSTCLGALALSAKSGKTRAVNDSKGCGAVMRAAPYALIARTMPEAYTLAASCGAITHGHTEGYGSAGVFAAILFELVHGMPLPDAVASATGYALKQVVPPTLTVSLAVSALSPRSRELWAGWVGEEAVATAVACALDYHREVVASGLESVARPFDPESAAQSAAQADAIAKIGAVARAAIWRAAAHPGDSDSTASMAAQLIGAMGCEPAWLGEWQGDVELDPVIAEMAGKLEAAYQRRVEVA